MEVHPLLGQLDCLLAGEEAKRGEKCFTFCNFYIFAFLTFKIFQLGRCLIPPASPLA